MDQAASWQALALSRLGKLMGTDAVDADGVEVEDSPFYHFYVLSAAEQDSQWMHKYGIVPPPGFDEKLLLMFDYASYAPMPNGYIPLTGSSVTLDMRKLSPKVYSESALDNLDAISGFDMATPQFAFVRSAGAQGTSPTQLNKRYSVSGQSFLRTGFGSPADFGNQTWLSFNAGAYRSEHCHLDALAITYFSDGIALLPDSGLYEYLTIQTVAEANFFRGTSAHNTVVVDGIDQSGASPIAGEVAGGLVASGDGWAYQSASHTLYAGVTHRRSVMLLANDVALVVDALDSDSPHAYTQTWHLWPDATISQNGLDVAATGSAGGDGGTGQVALALHQAVTSGVTLSTIKGQETPRIQGFYSDEYEKKVPNQVLEYTVSASSSRFATLIASGAIAADPGVVRATFGNGGQFDVTVCIGSVSADIVVQNQAAPGENVAITPPVRCP
jgi:hypothetical protein